MLDVDSDGLTIASTVSSGGTKPISISAHKNLVYVLNAGGTANISDFSLDSHGKLHAIPGSTQLLNTANPTPVNGRYAYAANAGSGTLTGFKVAQGGSLSLHNANASTAQPGGKPLDTVLSENSQYLYVFNGVLMQINAYAAQEGGSLNSLGSPMTGLPSSATGIAGR